MRPAQPRKPDSRAATELLRKASGATARASGARDELLVLVYDDLRRLARSYVSREKLDLSFSATDLVHEAYGRLVDHTRVDWQGRSHFFAVAAQAMRRILVDRARRRRRLKRGGTWQRITLEPESLNVETEKLDPTQVLALDRALNRLAALDERQAKVVELRYFAGMSVPEVAKALGVSPRSVDRDWTHARSWLKRELAEGDAEPQARQATRPLPSGPLTPRAPNYGGEPRWRPPSRRRSASGPRRRAVARDTFMAHLAARWRVLA